jgi:dethiobiotin synthetase
MNGLFITGTGTDIGKTFVLSQLIKALNKDCTLEALKPIISGYDFNEQTDSHVLLSAYANDVTEQNINQISPFRYRAPLSPDQAAHLEHQKLDFDALIQFCQNKLEDNTKLWLVEGVGGVLVPLNEKYTTLDWMSALNLPIVLVAGSYLGALSHTLSAWQVLRARKLQVLCVVLNQSERCVGLTQTKQSLEPFLKETPVIAWHRHANHCPKSLLDIVQKFSG